MTLCASQVQERSARADLELHVRERDSGCISAVLGEVPHNCIVYEEYSAMHDGLNVKQLLRFPLEQERRKEATYEKTSELDHSEPVHCGGLTTPANVFQMCAQCHHRKTQIEKSLGKDVLRNFFNSLHSLLDDILFDGEDIRPLSSLRLTPQQVQRIQELDRQIENGFVRSSYFPTQISVKQLRAKKYFQEHCKKMGWVILTVAERTQKIEKLRKVETFHGLIEILVALPSASCASEPFKVDDPVTPPKRKKPRVGDAGGAGVIELSDSQ
jgi:hypothetical protein